MGILEGQESLFSIDAIELKNKVAFLNHFGYKITSNEFKNDKGLALNEVYLDGRLWGYGFQNDSHFYFVKSSYIYIVDDNLKANNPERYAENLPFKQKFLDVLNSVELTK